MTRFGFLVSSLAVESTLFRLLLVALALAAFCGAAAGIVFGCAAGAAAGVGAGAAAGTFLSFDRV